MIQYIHGLHGWRSLFGEGKSLRGTGTTIPGMAEHTSELQGRNSNWNTFLIAHGCWLLSLLLSLPWLSTSADEPPFGSGYRKLREQMGNIRDGLFLLLSLLMGFTLTMAATRFAERRSLLIEEGISIGTTYLRTMTLPPLYRDHSRQLLREYLNSRIELNNAASDPEQLEIALRHSKQLQTDLWSDAAAAAEIDHTAITATYINSLNETIALDVKRVASFENRIPPPIVITIMCVAVAGVFSRGCTITSRFWLALIMMPITISVVVALIDDLDTPSRGLLHLDQRVVLRLKADMFSEPPPITVTSLPQEQLTLRPGAH